MIADYFIRSLLRIAVLQGRDVLEAVVTGQFQTVQNGAVQMISSSMPGQAFSFAVDAKLGISQIMACCEQALEIFDSEGIHAVRAALTEKPVTVARVCFGG